MSPRSGRRPLPPAGSSRPDPIDQTWQTPAPEPVPAPDTGAALAVRGSRRALWRFARGALVRWAIFVLPLAGLVAVEFTDEPAGTKVFCGLCAVVVAWSPVRRTRAVLRATRAMATRPWRLYRTATVPLVGPVRMEVWQEGDKQATHGYLRVTASGVKRDALGSPVYRNVWIAGDVARGGVVVPSGGGEDLIWARAVRGPKPRRSRAAKPARPAKPKSAGALARERARAEKARERAAKARARAAARAEKARQRAKDNPPPLRPVKTPKPRQPRVPRRGRGIGKGLPFQ